MACMRNKHGRAELSQLANSEEDYICMGYNSPADRSVISDRFCVCFKNDTFDEESFYDKHDILDVVAVYMRALSCDENNRLINKFTEEEMNEVNFTEEPQ